MKWFLRLLFKAQLKLYVYLLLATSIRPKLGNRYQYYELDIRFSGRRAAVLLFIHCSWITNIEEQRILSLLPDSIVTKVIAEQKYEIPEELLKEVPTIHLEGDVELNVGLEPVEK